MSNQEDLVRWKNSGGPRQRIVARDAEWDHQDWMSLVEHLESTVFWPIAIDALGNVLAELKKDVPKVAFA